MNAGTGNRRSGFTLIELLVVITIIGILVSLLLPVVGKIRERARRLKTAALIHDLELACSSYRLENGQYPWTKPPDVPAKATSIVPEDVYAELRNDPVLTTRVNVTQDYLGEVPRDFQMKVGANRIKLQDSWKREIHFLVKLDTLKPVFWSEGNNEGKDDPDNTLAGSETANAADGSDIDRTLFPLATYPLATYPTSYYWYGKSGKTYDDLRNY